MLAGLFLAFFTSAIICLFLIINNKNNKTIYYNSNLDNHSEIHNGPQKIHKTPTPRVGGIAIYLGFLAFILYLYFTLNKNFNKLIYIYFVAGIPFITGFLEDISAKFKPSLRFLTLSIASAIAFQILDAKITRLDIPFDFLLNYDIFSFIFTVFALTGITNSINIIDGFNGLASLSSIISFASFAYVSIKVGDEFLLIVSLGLIASTFGFLIFNYPCGLIFLGDGGAYFLGFMIGLVSTYLFNTYKQVSPWYPLLVNIYPVFEVLYSIYRRKIIKQKHAFNPDCMHFHSLVYKRMHKWIPVKKIDYLKRNSMTTVFVIMFSAIGIIPANLFWNNSIILAVFFAIFVVSYIYTYWFILIPKSVKKEICVKNM